MDAPTCLPSPKSPSIHDYVSKLREQEVVVESVGSGNRMHGRRLRNSPDYKRWYAIGQTFLWAAANAYTVSPKGHTACSPGALDPHGPSLVSQASTTPPMTTASALDSTTNQALPNFQGQLSRHAAEHKGPYKEAMASRVQGALPRGTTPPPVFSPAHETGHISKQTSSGPKCGTTNLKVTGLASSGLSRNPGQSTVHSVTKVLQGAAKRVTAPWESPARGTAGSLDSPLSAFGSSVRLPSRRSDAHRDDSVCIDQLVSTASVSSPSVSSSSVASVGFTAASLVLEPHSPAEVASRESSAVMSDQSGETSAGTSVCDMPDATEYVEAVGAAPASLSSQHEPTPQHAAGVLQQRVPSPDRIASSNSTPLKDGVASSSSSTSARSSPGSTAFQAALFLPMTQTVSEDHAVEPTWQPCPDEVPSAAVDAVSLASSRLQREVSTTSTTSSSTSSSPSPQVRPGRTSGPVLSTRVHSSSPGRRLEKLIPAAVALQLLGSHAGLTCASSSNSPGEHPDAASLQAMSHVHWAGSRSGQPQDHDECSNSNGVAAGATAKPLSTQHASELPTATARLLDGFTAMAAAEPQETPREESVCSNSATPCSSPPLSVTTNASFVTANSQFTSSPSSPDLAGASSQLVSSSAPSAAPGVKGSPRASRLKTLARVSSTASTTATTAAITNTTTSAGSPSRYQDAEEDADWHMDWRGFAGPNGDLMVPNMRRGERLGSNLDVNMDQQWVSTTCSLQ